jgi:hypothetical protein
MLLQSFNKSYIVIHNVALNNDLTDEEVWSMVKYMSKKKLTLTWAIWSDLELMKLRCGKGKDFVVVLVDLDRRQLIEWLSQESKKT